MNRFAKEIMDLRDSRIRLQRRVAMLEDKELWEPKNFTEEDAYWLRYYRENIVHIKATEDELRHRMNDECCIGMKIEKLTGEN